MNKDEVIPILIRDNEVVVNNCILKNETDSSSSEKTEEENTSVKKPNEIVKELMKLRGYTNASFAKKLNKSNPSAVFNALTREYGMRIDSLLEMLEALDCKIIVKSKLEDEREWEVSFKDSTD